MHAAPRQAVLAVTADIQQFGKQSQRTEHPEKRFILFHNRQARHGGIFQNRDCIQKRGIGFDDRHPVIRHVAEAHMDIVAGIRRLHAEPFEKPCGTFGQHPRANRRNLFHPLSAPQLRQSIRRSDAVDIRIAVSAHKNPRLPVHHTKSSLCFP